MKRALALALAATGLLAALAARPTPARAQSDAALLDTLQHASFLYFWNEANPGNGLVKDRSTPGSVCSIASTGFGLSAICVAADHGWITRDQARDRVLTTLGTFWNGPQSSAASGTIGYKGWFYHWLDMTTATRTWDSELSTIDTALLFGGILDCQQYFTQDETRENQIRLLADTLYRRVDWNLLRNFNPGIMMGWKPGTGFSGFGQWIGYNEAMILYLLALGSPTHPVPATSWDAWTSGYQWQTQYGQTYVTFPPLFGHQYSHCWVDFRDRRDAYMRAHGIDYFENSRRATLAQRAYSIANPFGWAAYSDSLWGITASDDPAGYAAHGAPPPQSENGTLTPTAAISSIPFTPDESMAVVRTLWNHWRPSLWGPYGWKDAFNPTQGWTGTDVLGIDQGPIVLMIENHRNGAVWERFTRSPYIQAGLDAAGFQYLPLGAPPASPASGLALWRDPGAPAGTIRFRFRLPRATEARLDLLDLQGRRVAPLANGPYRAGEHTIDWNSTGQPAGIYFARLGAADGVVTLRVMSLH